MTRIIATTAILFALLIPTAASAQPAVFLVRHAERADTGMAAPAGADPDLSPAGHARAAALARMLTDARITHIYVTEYKRTHQTAAPLAKLQRIEPTVITSKETPELTARLKAAAGNVLVVGHSNTVPAIVKALGIDEAITIADSEFDNLFVVTRGPAPLLLRLRY